MKLAVLFCALSAACAAATIPLRGSGTFDCAFGQSDTELSATGSDGTTTLTIRQTFDSTDGRCPVFGGLASTTAHINDIPSQYAIIGIFPNGSIGGGIQQITFYDFATSTFPVATVTTISYFTNFQYQYSYFADRFLIVHGTFDIVPTPEPSSLAATLSGLGLLFYCRRRFATRKECERFRLATPAPE